MQQVLKYNDLFIKENLERSEQNETLQTDSWTKYLLKAKDYLTLLFVHKICQELFSRSLLWHWSDIWHSGISDVNLEEYLYCILCS